VRLRSILLALSPAALLALLAMWSGTFTGAAAWPAGPLGQAALLAVALAAVAWGVDARDPLALGRAGRWLPAALLVVVAAGVAASPAPRAGRAVLALLPAFLLLPAAIAAVLADRRRRDVALAAWSGAVAAVAAWALVAWAGGAGPRPAEPLGHHNLLAAFLVTTLPVALLPARRRGLGRVLALAAGVLGGVALAASRSLSGALAVAGVAVVAAARPGGGRRWIVALALGALALATPRLLALAGGADSSAAARLGYAEGALAGWAARPLLGWGAGTTPWRLAEFLRPVPGVHPPGELVGQSHALPLTLAFETGLSGVVLAVATLGLFSLRRRRERAAAGADAPLVTAGLLGLLGATLAALGDAAAVPALPVAAAATAGAALAGAGHPQSGGGGRAHRWAAAAALVVLGGAAAALVRPAAAQARWSAAARAEAPGGEARRRALATAARLDPAFPLYAAAAAWQGGEPVEVRARSALAAAAAAGGVAPLWLRAGTLALEADDRAAARRAFARALALDPLSGVAPFLLFVAGGGVEVDCAARAMLAEPRLAAAVWWRAFPRERQRAVDRVVEWPRVDAGWRGEFRDLAAAARPEPGGSEEIDLVVEVDRDARLSLALHLFRRVPLPAELARVRLDLPAARRIGLPPAAELLLAAPAAFPHQRCAPVSLFAPPGGGERDEVLFRDSFETGDLRRWTPGFD